MNVKKIAALVAVACAGMSGAAQATISDATHKSYVTDAQTNGRVFFISGASATQKGFGGIIASLFEPGQFIRLANTTASSRDFEGVAGVLKASIAGWGGQKVIIIDRVKGGSVFGVNPVARDFDGNGVAPNEGEKIQQMCVTDAACSGTAGAGTSANPYVCTLSSDATPLVDGKIPDAGISDVAPKMFKEPFNTEGEPAVQALQLSQQELDEFSNGDYNKPIYTLAFGVPATNNTNPAMLNRAAVSAIMTGNVGTWDQVDSTLPADDVIVCRRVQGSGTQAVDNMYFGNFPCGESNSPADRGASSAFIESVDNPNYVAGNTKRQVGDYFVNGNSGSIIVIENSTSGDVRNCLTNAAAAFGGVDKTYATKDRSGAAVDVTFKGRPGTVGYRAIGVLSMDSLSSSSTSATGWSFRSLDGNGKLTCVGTAAVAASNGPDGLPGTADDVAAAAATGCPYVTGPTPAGTGTHPTKENLMNGSYPLQGWVSWNVPVRTQNDANKSELAKAFVAAAQDPLVLDAVLDLKYTAAALPSPFSPYSGAGVSKAAYANGDQCAPLNRNSAP
jgi:ABC-type phosphate transport system substrate-binding protein